MAFRAETCWFSERVLDILPVNSVCGGHSLEMSCFRVQDIIARSSWNFRMLINNQGTFRDEFAICMMMQIYFIFFFFFCGPKAKFA